MLETPKAEHDYLGETVLDETMGNQQGTVSESEVAWLAGIIEGEGTLMLGAWSRGAQNKQRKVSATIVIYNTDDGIVKKCVEILRRMGMEPYIKEKMIRGFLREDGTRSPDSPVTSVRIDRFAYALKLLRTIRPWLFGMKSSRADLMIEFLAKRMARIDDVGGNQRQQKYSADELSIVSRFYELCTHRRAARAKPSRDRFLNGLLNEHEQPTQ